MDGWVGPGWLTWVSVYGHGQSGIGKEVGGAVGGAKVHDVAVRQQAELVEERKHCGGGVQGKRQAGTGRGQVLVQQVSCIRPIQAGLACCTAQPCSPSEEGW